jgi:AcrR family transcriptional regulator
MAQARTTGRPLRKDAARNRQRILEAARELFAQQGISATLNEIARHAGVGVGTVYRHFPDREQLIDDLFEERIDALAAAMRSGLQDPDPWQGLTGFLERALELQAADRGLQDLVLGAAGAFERIASARARLYPLGAQLLKRARDSGELRADIEPQDMPIIQLMLWPVIDASHEFAPDLWRRYIQIVLDGLRAKPRPPEALPVAPPPPERIDQMLAAWKAKPRR